MTARTGAATGAPATATASLTTAAVPPAARHPIIRVTFRGGVIIYGVWDWMGGMRDKTSARLCHVCVRKGMTYFVVWVVQE